MDRRPRFVTGNRPRHLIAHNWSAAASWIATGLGLYGAFWCHAGSIAHIGNKRRPGVRVIPRGSEPNVCLEFKEPLTTELIFGIRRPLSAISLVADDPEALTAALRRMAY